MDSSILTADWDPAECKPDPAQEKGVKDGPKIWEGHEWNAVKLGSQWYLLDATWTTYDDRGKGFNQSGVRFYDSNQGNFEFTVS